jgi:hypothetical protein
VAKLKGVNVAEYGKPIQIYCRKDGAIQNVTGFSTKVIKFWSPEPVKRIQIDAVYTSTGAGADGILEFAFTSDVYPDRAGDWKGQVWLEGGAKLMKSEKFTIEVGE